MARTLEPTFGTVKVTPTHLPPAGVAKDTLAKSVSVSSERTGKGPYAVKHQSTSQLQIGSNRQGFTTTEGTGKDFSAAKHQSTSQLQTGTDQPRSSSLKRTGKDFSAKKHQSTDRPKSSDLTGTDSPALHRSRKDSISSLNSGVDSDISDQPPLDLCVEEGKLSVGQDATLTEQDQSISVEQTYRETMRGICSYMAWSHI